MKMQATTTHNNVVHSAYERIALGISSELVTMRVHNQLFGVPVDYVCDVMPFNRITSVPLAPSYIAGVLNLRGRIVTVIDMRNKLGLPPLEQTDSQRMNAVVEYKNEMYSLLVDGVGDVLKTAPNSINPVPETLSSGWRSVAAGVCMLDKELMVVLDIEKLLFINNNE